MQSKIVIFLCISAVTVFSLPHQLNHPTGWLFDGIDAIVGQFPYVVSIEKPPGHHHCAGNLISSRWVLTAGYCCIKDVVRKYALNAGTNTLTPQGTVYNVSQIVVHPEYNLTAHKFFNDICLMQASEDIIETDLIKRVELETSINDTERDAILAGWGVNVFDDGFPNNLHYIELHTVPHDQCVELWGDDAPWAITESQVCGYTRYGQGPCFSDTGTALTVAGDNGNRKAIGLTSWVDLCGSGFPDIYTRISSYIPWIEEVTNETF